jgi:uridine kinase
MDSYYQPQPHLAAQERALRNYDHPDALDWALVEMHLDLLAEGHTVEVPVYLFDEHTRAGHTYALEAGEVVIVEGILALHHAGIRSRANLKAFIDTDAAECLRRRLERDIAERGRTRESVLAQYGATVEPMNTAYVLPSRAYADVIVSGEEPLDQTASEILRCMGGRLQPADRF